jgi:Stigma-specific protein, Stig1
MTPLHRVFLCAVVIILVLTAGCALFKNTSGASPPIPGQATAAAMPAPTAAVPAGTTQPGAAGTQAAGTCTANINSDPANCGGCGYACPANALCQQGQCYCGEGYVASNNQCVAAPSGASGGTDTGNGCPAGMSPCPDGYCYDLSTATDNCGICGNTCPSGMICSASTCANAPTEVTTAPTTTVTTTPTTSSGGGSGTGLHGSGTATLNKCIALGLTNCGGTCFDTSTSAAHCGSCVTSCVMTKYPACCDGKCVNLKTDTSNCGSCGKKCLGLNPMCETGTCKSKVIIGSGLSKTKLVPSLVQVNPGIIVGPIGP